MRSSCCRCVSRVILTANFLPIRLTKRTIMVAPLSILCSPAEAGRRTTALKASDSDRASTGHDGGQADANVVCQSPGLKVQPSKLKV